MARYSKVKLPKFVKVLGRRWKIKMTKDLNASELSALADPNSQTIFMSESIPDEDKFQILLHEIKHVHQYESGLAECMSTELMEIDAETTSRMLLEVFDIKFKNK